MIRTMILTKSLELPEGAVLEVVWPPSIMG
jgi:hypothetical protein